MRRERARRESSARDASGPASSLPPSASPWLTWLLLPAAILWSVAWSSIRPLSDPDTWFHMALGREALNHGTLPRADIFSHTATGNEWISSGWLASVVMEALFRTFGEGGTGLVLLVFAVISAAYLLIYTSALRTHGPATGSWIVLPLLAGLMAAAHRFQPRPDIWTQLFMAGTALVLLAAERRLEASPQWPRTGRIPPLLWTLPLLFTAWANLHAGYLAGLLIVGIFMVHLGHTWWRTPQRTARGLLVLLPCALAFVTWMLNPYGPGLARLAGKIASIPGVGLVYEWMPLIYYPRFASSWPVYAGFFLLLGLAAASLRLKRDQHRAGLRLWHLAALALLFVLALWQRRQIALAAVGVSAFLLPALPLLAKRMGNNHRLLAGGALLLAGGISLLQFRGTYGNEGGWPKIGRTESLPVYATEFLTAAPPPGQMYNSYNIGGYLLYHLGIEKKVFIDGRLDVYPHQVWLDSLAVENASLSLDDFVSRYGVDWMVIQISDAFGDPQHLASRVTASNQWHLVHFDDRYGVFVRGRPEASGYLQEHAFRHVNPLAPEKLVQALAARPSRAAAIREVKRALEQSGRGAAALSLAALTAASGGGVEDARKYLAEAQERNPASPLVGAMAGRIFSSAHTAN